jgi:MFS family permease
MSKNNAEVYFSLLYSIYSLPNILLPLISGLLIDMYGDQIMTLIFSFLILAGWIFFSLGL